MLVILVQPFYTSEHSHSGTTFSRLMITEITTIPNSLEARGTKADISPVMEAIQRMVEALCVMITKIPVHFINFSLQLKGFVLRSTRQVYENVIN